MSFLNRDPLFIKRGFNALIFILAGHFKRSKDEPLQSSVKTYGTATNSRCLAQCCQGTLTPESGVTHGHFISGVCRLVFPRCHRGEETTIAILGLFFKFPSSYPARRITPIDGCRKKPRSSS